MAAPLVSICIPAYKQVRYLRKTLDSVLHQTYTDFEVIITDDSPDDAVRGLVDEYQTTIPRLIYHRNRPALGTPANWNKAVSLATGTFVKVLHHDDWFTGPGSLAKFVSTAEQGGLDMVCSAALATNEARNETKLHQPSREIIQDIFDHPHRLLLGNLIGPPSSVLYRRDLGVRFNERHKFVVDHEFYRDILWKTGKAAYIEEPLITSISGSDHNVTNDCFTREIDLKENLDLYPSSGPKFKPQERPELVRYLVGLFSRYGIKDVSELLALKPDLAIDGTIRKALRRSRMKGTLRRWKAHVTGSAMYRWMRSGPRKEHQVSYSQCGEDLIVAHIFRSLSVKRPFYLDIGAHHPRFLNNTCFFYKDGGSGVNIEPDPKLFRAFGSARPRDTNLNFGVTHEQGERLADFHIFNAPTLNTFSKEEADRVAAEDERYRVVETKKIRIRNINEVLAEHIGGKRIDLLSMDVEGLDDKLIMAWDFDLYKPLVICLETISYSATGRGTKNEEIIRYVIGKGYMLYADTNVNSIFVLENEWRR